jgi:hypothetical protein
MSKFRRMLMMANTVEPVPPTPVLPYDAEVEWLGCDGGQYIEDFYTEKSTVNVLIFRAKFKGYGDIIGNASSYQNGCKIFGTLGTTHLFAYYKPTGTRILLQETYSADDIVNVSCGFSKTSGKFSLTLSGVTPQIGNYSKLYSTVSHRLLSRKNTGTNFIGNLYSFEVEEDGVLVRNLISVRKDGVGYFYDKVNDKLWGNDGTGAFTYGNDVTT